MAVRASFSLPRGLMILACAYLSACGAFTSAALPNNDNAGGDGMGTSPSDVSPTAGQNDGGAGGGSNNPATSDNNPLPSSPNAVPGVGNGNASPTPNDGATAGGNKPVAAPTFATEPYFGFGTIIDFDGLGLHGKQSVQSFVTATKVVPTVVDSYVQLKKDGTFELNTAKGLIEQAAAAGVPTVCLSVTCQVQGKLPEGQLASLVESVTYGRSMGIHVEVRFGYEMNGYWSPSNKTGTTANAPANFLLQWAQVAPAVQAAGGRMFWSPNIPFDSNSALARWTPADPKTIDMIGLDFYPKDRVLTTATVRYAMDTIYPIAQKMNKPFYFGESAWQITGTSFIENSSEAQKKIAWVAALSDATVRKNYPLYRGFRWFDYQKFENDTYNNFAISADPFAASAFTAWYKTSVFATQK